MTLGEGGRGLKKPRCQYLEQLNIRSQSEEREIPQKPMRIKSKQTAQSAGKLIARYEVAISVGIESDWLRGWRDLFLDQSPSAEK